MKPSSHVPRPSTNLDAAVAARVLERAHAHVVGAHHDHRLVEELVLGVVVRLRDLLEPARHLPDAGPQLLGLQRVEVGVEVALLGDPVRTSIAKAAPGAPTAADRTATPRRYTNRSVQSPGTRDLTGHAPHPARRRPTSTCSSSAPASPASTSCTAPGRPASRRCCSRRAAASGGTWFWNRYPGARFDSESYTYGYLFSKELFDEWEWQEHFAEQPETERYLNHVVDRFDLRRDMRFDARSPRPCATSASGTWTVTVGDGAVYRARFLVAATGVLSVPFFPDVPGRDEFRGEQHHTGLWPAEPVDFAGKRVAVVGTGSSGVQLVPTIAAEVASLTVYQRTANWCTPAQQPRRSPPTSRRSCAPTSRRSGRR